MKIPFKAINIFKPYVGDKYQKPLPKIPDQVWHRPLYFFVFGFGSGAMPFAPGTFGTLLAIPFYLFIQSWSLLYYFLFVLIFIIVSVIACEKISNEIHVHDHPGMCIDEFCGYFVTMMNAPHGIIWILLGFLLFRFFDIWKPWPIFILDQKMTGGLGIILDDVLAGLFAFVLIQIIALLIGSA